MTDQRWDFWNSPFYKPKIKLHEIFWEEFQRAAYVILENQRRRIANPLDKDPDKHRELGVYDVFDWMRQELHDELPYTQKRCEALDAQIEKEFSKDAVRRASSQSTIRG
jgi:hypothetical protein